METISLRQLIWLDELDQSLRPLVGSKAAILGALRQSRFPVPNGFCLTVAAYHAFVAAAGLQPLITAIAAARTPEEIEAAATTIRRAIVTAQLDTALQWEINTALGRLGPDRRVAVRSSAITEDLDDASAAGQQESYLDVAGLDEVVRRVRDAWASLWTARAVIYRRRHRQIEDVAMAVLIQEMVQCEIAGVAFTVDPVTGERVIVVEATAGLGSELTQGLVVPERFVLTHALLPPRSSPASPSGWRPTLLSPAQQLALGQLALALERHLGGPQDLEWGLSGGRLVVFQARPVTSVPGPDCFEEPGGEAMWTSGFLDERFPEPVSPLGWSALRPAFEEIAFREPLRLLGAPDVEAMPITRLRRGHPYVNLAAFSALYKLFPDWLLPEDARRYFPNGEVTLRRLAPHPRSLVDPRLWLRLARVVLREPANWSPYHNYRLWQRFGEEYDRAIAAAGSEATGRRPHPGPLPQGEGTGATTAEILEAVRTIDRWNRELLRIHRWSLTHADVLYSALSRLSRLWFGEQAGAEISAAVVSNLGDRSMEMNRALTALAARVRAYPDLIGAARKGVSYPSFRVAAERTGATAVLSDLDAFLARYGHRSLSLDLVYRSFEADPDQLVPLIGRLLESSVATGERFGRGRQAEAVHLIDRLLGISWLDRLLPVRQLVFRRLVALTQAYVRLREDQRFAWQKGIAALRLLYRQAGEIWARDGVLDSAEQVFYLTRQEVDALTGVSGAGVPPSDAAGLAAARRRRYARLRAEFEQAPCESYPPHLMGDQPLVQTGQASGLGQTTRLRGQPVSPGLTRGRVRVVLAPEKVPVLERGEVLVTRGADPGWTPLFGTIGALVMESGGQLSHGSVVAREYGIPAVAGVAGATSLLRDGDEVVVDGRAGIVTRVA
ncbi:MAG: hypothetical protein HYY04_02475 [Chloroflexi bacterium]|nr:hypothetical protein [Chloroflexota bacterium]